MSSNVRTRFAPSPTGFQHVGGIRTALFAWLLAKKNNGQFLLRIEDTDQSRTVPGAVRYVLEELAWFGIDIDEGPSKEDLQAIGEDWDEAPNLGGSLGPYVQSQRKERYKRIANLLLEKGFAYRCDQSSQPQEEGKDKDSQSKVTSSVDRYREVDPNKPHTIRLKVPVRKSIVLNDAIKGKITWNSVPLRDPVLLKSDGFPTYHLASVVDDHDMQISHVIRGDEWVATTPLHLLIYEYLGWEPPTFVHLPPVLGTDGKKLSKRHGSTQTSMFRENGYLPEALLNFMVLVGWSPGSGDEQEIFTVDELIEKFSLTGVNTSGGVFDFKKLDWMNGIYLRDMSTEDFIKQAKPFLEKAGLTKEISEGAFAEIAELVKERLKTLSELPAMVDFLFEKDNLEFDYERMLGKKVSSEQGVAALERIKKFIVEEKNLELQALTDEFENIARDLELKIGSIMLMARVAVLTKRGTPPLYESMKALGCDVCVSRLEKAIDFLEENK